MNIVDLPLDCLTLIAKVSLPAYRAMLMIKRFALTTLADNNVKFRKHFTVVINLPKYTVYIIDNKRLDNDKIPSSYSHLRTIGTIHRDDDLPAVIGHDGTQSWWWYGRMHRDNDRPAIIHSDGSKTWYIQNKKHREGDQPAFIGGNGTKVWYKYDRYHRINGPAVIRADGISEWYIDGRRMSMSNDRI
jgi:hypothetical protein